MLTDLPRHIPTPALSNLAARMLAFIAARTMDKRYGGYVASWHISRGVEDTSDLDCVCSNHSPGNAAMLELKRAGLVEDVPDLGCRYQLTPLGCAVALLNDAAVERGTQFLTH